MILDDECEIYPTGTVDFLSSLGRRVIYLILWSEQENSRDFPLLGTALFPCYLERKTLAWDWYGNGAGEGCYAADLTHPLCTLISGIESRRGAGGTRIPSCANIKSGDWVGSLSLHLNRKRLACN